MQLPLDFLPTALIVLTTPDFRTLAASRFTAQLAAPFWGALAVPGQRLDALPESEARATLLAACREATMRGEPHTLSALAVRGGNPDTFWDISLSFLPPEEGDAPRLLLALTDVTEATTQRRERQRLAARLAAETAHAVHLTEELRQRADDLEALNAIGRALSSSLDLPTVLEQVLASLSRVVRYDRASVAIRDTDGAHLRVVSDTAAGGGQTGSSLPIAGSLRGYVFRSGQPLHLARVTAEMLPLPARLPLAEYPASLIVVPLVVSDRAIGTLSVLSDTPGALTHEDARRVEGIAAQVAIAIANAQLYAEVRERLDDLRLLNADLAEANRHKSVFLATMSHELRTPLNAIIGFAELLADDMIEDTDEQQQSLHDILHSGQHLLALINAVLDLVKVEAGQMRVSLRPLALDGELTSVVRVMQAWFAARDQQFTVTIPPDLPRVFADPERTRQVVLNLLTNANKFTPDGGIITLTAGVNDAGEVEIRVADTGIGIAPEDAPLVWQEFRQIDSTVSRRYEGTGLGLALVRRFLDLMGGRVWFESAVGRGTTFFVTLPAADAVGAAATAATAADGGGA